MSGLGPGGEGGQGVKSKGQDSSFSHSVFQAVARNSLSQEGCLKIWKGWQMGSPAPGRLSTLSPIVTYSTGQGNRTSWSYTYDLLQGIGSHDCGAG